MSSIRQQTSPYLKTQEMYDITNRNYQWEEFKYQVPKYYHSKQQRTYLPINKTQHKKSFIDDVLKIKKSVPAPSAYQIQQNVRPLSGKMDKNPRKTLTDEIINKSKAQKQPGPASYFDRPKTADPKFNRKAPQYREHYLHQVEYLSSEYPGVGEYNINYFKTSHVSTPKLSKIYKNLKTSNNISSHKQSKRRGKQEQSRTIVPGTFDWIAIANSKKPSNNNFFGKSKRFITGSKFDKKPGPNSYCFNTKWSDSKNLLKTSSSFTNFKSVYYN